MGDVLSVRKIQVAVVAAIAALALGFVMFGAQAAYADDGQYQAGSILTIQENDPGVTSTQSTGASKADYTTDKNGGATVTYKICKSTKKTTANVPANIKINGKSYKVTAIAKNAFNKSKVKTVTVGTNIKKIYKNAFNKSKVKTINVKTLKLKKKSVKGALKGSSVTTVKVPASKYKAYKKYFTYKNCGKKVTVKKLK